MYESAHKFNELTAWGVSGNDLRDWGVTWDSKLNNLANKFKDLKIWGVTWNDLRARERFEGLGSNGE